MVKRKSVVAAILALVMIFSILPTLTIFASSDVDIDDTDTTDEDKYVKLFNTKASPYMMTCQPDSALVLEDTVDITEDMLSPNYHGGVVDLPRLSSDYYYSLGSNQNYFLGETMYPILCWKSAARGTNVTLNIRTMQSKRTVASFTIQISDDKYDLVNNNVKLNGVDYWYPSSDIVDNANSGTVIVPKRDFVDCSSEVLRNLVDAGPNVHHLTGYVNLYPGESHTCSIVMDRYVFDSCADVLDAFKDLSDVSFDVAANAYQFIREDVGMNGVSVVNNVKDYIGTLNSGYGIRSGILFGGSKIDKCTYDTNTGVATTVTEMSDTDDLYSFIALSGECYFSCVTTKTVDTDTFTDVDDTAPKLEWSADKYYYLESGTNEDSAGFTGVVQDGYMDYGPVSFDAFWKVCPNIGISMRNGMYGFMHSLGTEVSNVNVFAETLLFAGCLPHIGTAKLLPAKSTLTLNYYYASAGETGSYKWNLLTQDVINAELFDESKLQVLPAVDDFEATPWYTNPEMTKVFQPDTIDKNEDHTINLYAAYNYIGGSYYIMFYNDKDNTKDTKEFLMKDRVELPENPKGGNGYEFKNWSIVNNENDTSGVEYSSSTFKPTKGTTYIFKTMWDIKGVIIKVLANKSEYYVGEKIDKSTIKVVVQDGNEGKTRTLSDDEYTIEPEVVDKPGNFRFLITYTATGATATCEITGMEDRQDHIEAVYTRGDTVVGTELDKDDFEVTLYRASGKSEKIKDFTIDPKVISKTGENEITVTHAEFKVKVKVNGIKDPKSSSNIKSIAASYTGKTPYVGDVIKPSNMEVTALYEDGSQKKLTSSEYKYSPSKFSVAGEQYIVITYAGLSTSIKVEVKSKNNDNKPVTPEPTPEPTPTPTPTPEPEPSTPSDDPGGSTHKPNGSDDKKDEDKNKPLKDKDGNPVDPNDPNIVKPTDKEEKGPSPLYLSGATILTNTMGYANASTVNKVDIAGEIDKQPADSDMTLTLVNGASGNDVTTTMLEKLKEKKINLHINMVSPMDQVTIVAYWNVNGKTIDNTSINLNPNVTFSVIDKESDKLVYFSVTDIAYPEAVTCQVAPVKESYEAGELIRLYTCDVSLNNAKLKDTVTWSSDMNLFGINLTENKSFCLSNALDAYKDGSTLDERNSLPEEITGDEDYEDGYDFSDEETTEDELGDDFWDDTESTEQTDDTSVSASGKFSFRKLIPIIGLIAGILLLVGIIIVVIVMLKSKSSRGYSDDGFDGLEEYDDDSDDVDE